MAIESVPHLVEVTESTHNSFANRELQLHSFTNTFSGIDSPYLCLFCAIRRSNSRPVVNSIPFSME